MFVRLRGQVRGRSGSGTAPPLPPDFTAPRPCRQAPPDGRSLAGTGAAGRPQSAPPDGLPAGVAGRPRALSPLAGFHFRITRHALALRVKQYVTELLTTSYAPRNLKSLQTQEESLRNTLFKTSRHCVVSGRRSALRAHCVVSGRRSALLRVASGRRSALRAADGPRRERPMHRGGVGGRRAAPRGALVVELGGGSSPRLQRCPPHVVVKTMTLRLSPRTPHASL